MIAIILDLLFFLDQHEKIDNSALFEYKKKLDEEQEDKIKKTQAYKKMIELLDFLLKSNIKNENDISNLKNAVKELSIVVMGSTYNITDYGTISDFLKEHSKSQTSRSQS